MSKKKEIVLSFVLLGVGLIWGFGFIAVQQALDAGFSPTSINFLRFLVASILTLATFSKSIFKMKLSDVKAGIIPALMMSLGFFFQNLGQKYTTPGNNALITGSYTILVPLFLAVFFKKKPKKIAYFAALITFVGITVLSLPSFSADNIRIGDFFSLLAAIFFALQFITLEKALYNSDSKIQTFIQLLGACLLFFISFLFVDLKSLSQFDFSKGTLPILYLGVFSSYFAYVVQTYSQKFIAPTKVAIILASESLFGALLSVVFGYEKLTIYLIIGGLLSLCGIVLAQIPQKKESIVTKELPQNTEAIKKEKADDIEVKDEIENKE